MNVQRSTRGSARGRAATSGASAASSPHSARPRARGAVLVEFAMIAFAFYLLLAATVEIGRMILSSQLLNNAARVGARELALMPLPATMTFDQALHDPDVRETVYDKGLLVLDVSGMTASEIQTQIDGWPMVNRMLSSLMIREKITIGGTDMELLRYPGTLVQNPNYQQPPYFEANQYDILIAHIKDRDAQGHETDVEWLPVVQEIRPSTDDAQAPFSIASTGPSGMRGVVALRLNYPYQASMVSGYVDDHAAPGGPIVNTPIEAVDGGLTMPSGVSAVAHTSDLASQSGTYGLGRLYALGKEVRPYRRLISAQAIFRRERLGR